MDGKQDRNANFAASGELLSSAREQRYNVYTGLLFEKLLGCQRNKLNPLRIA